MAATHNTDAIALAAVSLVGAILNDLDASTGDPDRSMKVVDWAIQRSSDPRVLAVLKTFPHHA